MATENGPSNSQSSSNLPPTNEIQGSVPLEGIVSQVVARIKNEPFLFVIAIGALLIGFALLATQLGSPELRLIVLVIAFLSVIVIAGYYIQPLLRTQGTTKPIQEEEQVENKNQSASGKWDIDAEYIGAIVDGDGPVTVNQEIDLSGKSKSHGAESAQQYTLEDQRKTLEDELAQHQSNLSLLKTQKANYGVGEEPLNLLNKINDEDSEIKRIYAELDTLANNT